MEHSLPSSDRGARIEENLEPESTIWMPMVYAEGYAKARVVDRDAADNYIRHTNIGDPQLDPVMEDISSLSAPDLHRFIRAGMLQEESLRNAPESLRNFFQNLEDPAWLDHESFRPGVRVFHKYADLLIIAFVSSVLVEGFTTLIAKSFAITERTATTSRRLQQNLRQLLEIFYPQGMLRENDGWRTSVRVRFVHARIRNLLAKSDEWNHEAWGTPVSAASLGLAISIFSQRLLDYTILLGGRFTTEERKSILSIWRYCGYLMGIPETILYADGAEAKRIYQIAYLCEPPPDDDSVTMANALISSIPGVGKIESPVEQRKALDLAYRLSRSLLGNELANIYQFPKTSTFGMLYLFRMKQIIVKLFKAEKLTRMENFSQLLNVSIFDRSGLSYEMPDNVKNSKSNPW